MLPLCLRAPLIDASFAEDLRLGTAAYLEANWGSRAASERGAAEVTW